MTVKNMTNNRGNTIPNQFILTDGDKRVFQSYDSTIVMIKKGQVYLDPKYWAYSTTTGKYRNLFLGEERRETEAKIKSGEYKFKNLN